MSETHRVRFDSFLLRLIADRRNEKVESLLDQNQVNAFDTYGTLLHYAVTYDNKTIAQRLMDMGSAVDALGLDGKTPLMLAVEAQSPAMIEILLEARANIEITDTNGQTAMRMALDLIVDNSRMYRVFFRSIRAKASTNEQLVGKLTAAGYTLHDAVRLGLYGLVEIMLEYGIDVNLRNHRDATALHVATVVNDLEMADILIENGADLNARDADGWEPLRSALLFRKPRMVQLFLDQGADPNLENSGDKPEALESVFYNDKFENIKDIEQQDKCVAILLQYGSVVPKPLLDHATILDLALDVKGSRAPKYLIAQLAMQGMIGTLTDESIDYYMDMEDESKIAELEDSYRRCQRALKIVIFDKLTLLTLLNESEYRMRLRARNETFSRR